MTIHWSRRICRESPVQLADLSVIGEFHTHLAMLRQAKGFSQRAKARLNQDKIGLPAGIVALNVNAEGRRRKASLFTRTVGLRFVLCVWQTIRQTGGDILVIIFAHFLDRPRLHHQAMRDFWAPARAFGPICRLCVGAVSHHAYYRL